MMALISFPLLRTSATITTLVPLLTIPSGKLTALDPWWFSYSRTMPEPLPEPAATTPLLVFSATTDAKSVPEDSDAMTISKTSRSNI